MKKIIYIFLNTARTNCVQKNKITNVYNSGNIHVNSGWPQRGYHNAFWELILYFPKVLLDRKDNSCGHTSLRWQELRHLFSICHGGMEKYHLLWSGPLAHFHVTLTVTIQEPSCLWGSRSEQVKVCEKRLTPSTMTHVDMCSVLYFTVHRPVITQTHLELCLCLGALGGPCPMLFPWIMSKSPAVCHGSASLCRESCWGAYAGWDAWLH